MDGITGTLIEVIGLVIGGAVTWLCCRRELARRSQAIDTWRTKAETEARAAAEANGIARRVGQLQTDLADANSTITALKADMAAVAATAAEQAASARREIETLTNIRNEMLRDFQAAASQVLQDNQQSFLTLANESFAKHKVDAVSELDARREAISTLLQPVAQTLDRYQMELTAVERARQESYGQLSAELANVARAQQEVRSETAKLVNALRAAPQTRGRWGEEKLRNVMELSGMSEHCDFITQEHFEREDERLRPDVIIRLPGERFIVVDAKTSMTAYLDAFQATDEAERSLNLDRHAMQVRQHMKQLAAKSYWDGLTVTPDFVAMFIPGDNFFSAALERDPDLFTDAIKARVIMVTPTTLIALAKAVAFGWRQEKVAENAANIADLGRELYKRIATMGDHVMSMGRSLEASIRHYNNFVGSIEGSVLPQARRFNDLKVEGTAKALTDLSPIETDVREARTDRDLQVTPTSSGSFVARD